MSEAFKRMTEKKLCSYKAMNAYAKKGETVLLGSSLMEHFKIDEFLVNEGLMKTVYNRGVEGWRTENLYKNLDICVFELEPSRIFINIGSNDLDLPGDAVEKLIKEYKKLLTKIKARLPICKICIIAFYPMPKTFSLQENAPIRLRTPERIKSANIALETLAESMGIEFLDFGSVLSDLDGFLHPGFAADDVHLLPAAYKAIYEEIKHYL